MDQLVTTDPHVEGIPVTQSKEEYASFENPSTPTLVVVQWPSSHDSTFHFPMEGNYGARDWVFSHPSDDIVASKFGPTAPFWENSLRQTISEYNTTALSYSTPS